MSLRVPVTLISTDLVPQVYGIALVADLAGDATAFSVEVERADDDGLGAPDLGTTAVVRRLEPGRAVFVDTLPNDQALRHYRARYARSGWDAGSWTDWVAAKPVAIYRVPDERPAVVYTAQVGPLADSTWTLAVDSHAGVRSVRVAWTADPLEATPAVGAGAAFATDAQGSVDVTDLLAQSGTQVPSAATPPGGWAGPLKVRVTYYSGTGGTGNVLGTVRLAEPLASPVSGGDTTRWSDTYEVSTTAPEQLLTLDDAVLGVARQEIGVAFVAWGRNEDAGVVTGAVASFTWSGSAWAVEVLYEAGTTGSHVELFVDGSGYPAVRTFGTGSTVESVTVLVEEDPLTGGTIRALRGLDVSGALDSLINDGVGADNGSEVLPLAKGYESGAAADGVAVTFSRSFSAPPMVVLQGGKYVSNTYHDLAALNLSAAGFTMRAKNRTVSTLTPQTDLFAAGICTGFGDTVECNLTPGGAAGNTYTVQYDVEIDYSLGGGGESLEVVVAIDSNDGGGWVERTTRTYFASGGDFLTWANQRVAITVSNLLSNDDIRVRIKAENQSGFGIYTFTVDPDQVDYNTDSGGSEVSATPDSGETISWQALEVG